MLDNVLCYSFFLRSADGRVVVWLRGKAIILERHSEAFRGQRGDVCHLFQIGWSKGSVCSCTPGRRTAVTVCSPLMQVRDFTVVLFYSFNFGFEHFKI